MIKHIFMRKSEVSVEKIQFVMLVKNWQSMADTVCYAPIPMTSLVCYDSSSGISNCFVKYFSNMIYR